jgi:hypothetical protein
LSATKICFVLKKNCVCCRKILFGLRDWILMDKNLSCETNSFTTTKILSMSLQMWNFRDRKKNCWLKVLFLFF